MASTVVDSEQLEPMLVLAVGLQGTAAASGRSSVVIGTPASRSVMRSVTMPWSSPA